MTSAEKTKTRSHPAHDGIVFNENPSEFGIQGNIYQELRMTTPPFALLVLIGLVVVAIAVYVMNSRDERQWGFRQVLKHPEYWERVEEERQEVEAAAKAAEKWSDDKVASQTKAYLLDATSSREAWKEERMLRPNRERAIPTILTILADKSLYARLVEPTGTDIVPEAPFHRACDLLGDSPPAEVVDVVVPFLSDSSASIRKFAALVLGKTGDARIVPHIRQALSDPEEDVAQFALIGLEFSLARNRLQESTVRELFPLVRNRLLEGENAKKSAGVLFHLDSAEATKCFLSDDVFFAESPVIHEALAVLATSGTLVPRDRLLDLIRDLESMELKYPHTYTLGHALRLLGQHGVVDDHERIQYHLESSESTVAEGAAKGLLRSVNLDDYEQKLWDIEESNGYESLSPCQRHCAAVARCDAEVRNGGLEQYFVNSSGDHWQDAVAGLAAMGSKSLLAILREAVDHFGNDGPPTDRSARQRKLSRLCRKDESRFEELNRRWYKSKENTEVMTARYVVKHANEFR